jgi:UDP-N-acetylmuramyl pentapeptide phosphotransferase/UDP-N-acetylglucosamine-1-phosphate transferase
VVVVLLAAVPILGRAARPAPWVAWAAAAAVVAAVSWWDDLRGLTFRIRLAVHAAAAAAVVLVSPVQALDVPWLGAVDAGPAGTALAFVWIVGLTNAYNFMDGIDGIAGGQGVVAGVALAVAGAWAGLAELGGLAAASAAACAGFVLHNWPPARIFMGDVGSAFLGFSFAALACLGAADRPAVLSVAVLALWPFVFDTAFTFLRRLRRRENVFEAHRSHLYQRLVICGWSHALVSSLYVVLAAVGAAWGLAWIAGTTGADVGVAVTLPVLGLLLWATVALQERSGGRRRKESAHA